MHSHVPAARQAPWSDEISMLSLHVCSMPGVHTDAAGAPVGDGAALEAEDDAEPLAPPAAVTRNIAAAETAPVRRARTPEP